MEPVRLFIRYKIHKILDTCNPMTSKIFSLSFFCITKYHGFLRVVQ